ncbi:MAG: DUF2207 domain-containing protein [Gammaproteobacteria bacterium]|nr:DUF2207 domain-containing protein [Gammaproteobacteria bacterium]
MNAAALPHNVSFLQRRPRNVHVATRLIIAVFWFSAIFSFASQAQDDRSMHWDALEVDARLDADGRLHVSELQRMVFNGAWNGGERRFSMFQGQQLDFAGLARVDEQGQSYPLTEGDLDAINEYRWTDPSTLRWRSRLPKDPPFHDATFTYRIDYVLSGILRFEDEHYVLDHDFAFADRPGIIKHFLLRLTLDPVWNPDELLPQEIREDELKPGESVVIQRTLQYAGANRPAAVSHEPLPDISEDLPVPVPIEVPYPTRIALAATMVAGAAILLLIFSRREARAGRFRALLPPDNIDPAWLDQHVYVHLPEVVGMLWDGHLGSTEVAAVLARMSQEGKLASHVEKAADGMSRTPSLHLELKVPRDHLSGYEAELINALFFDGGTTTNTDKIQAHYRNTGFNPVNKIAVAVKWDVQRVVGMSFDVSFNVIPFLLLFVAAVMMIPVNVRFGTDEDGLVSALTVFSLFFYAIFALFGVAHYRRSYASWFQSVAGLVAVAAVFAVPVLVLLLYDPFNNSLYLFIELVTLWLAAFGGMLYGARTHAGFKAMEQRWLMSSARAWFKAELKKSKPSLDDARYPYLVALGLGGDADHWVQTFGASGAAPFDRREDIGASPASSGNQPWSGGGGAFGGAGASGSWVAAANGIAASIPDPSTRSSSSSGSSSSSSGGSSRSSGGGGGGAW